MGVYRSTGVEIVNVKNIVSFCFIKLGLVQIRLKSALLDLLLTFEPHGNGC
jgi:hypothetical protein